MSSASTGGTAGTAGTGSGGGALTSAGVGGTASSSGGGNGGATGRFPGPDFDAGVDTGWQSGQFDGGALIRRNLCDGDPCEFVSCIPPEVCDVNANACECGGDPSNNIPGVVCASPDRCTDAGICSTPPLPCGAGGTALSIITPGDAGAGLIDCDGLHFFSLAIEAACGTPPYRWRNLTQRMRPGISFAEVDGGAIISGVPLPCCFVPLLLEVDDAAGDSAFGSYVVTPALRPP